MKGIATALMLAGMLLVSKPAFGQENRANAPADSAGKNSLFSPFAKLRNSAAQNFRLPARVDRNEASVSYSNIAFSKYYNAPIIWAQANVSGCVLYIESVKAGFFAGGQITYRHYKPFDLSVTEYKAIVQAKAAIPAIYGVLGLGATYGQPISSAGGQIEDEWIFSASYECAVGGRRIAEITYITWANQKKERIAGLTSEAVVVNAMIVEGAHLTFSYQDADMPDRIRRDWGAEYKFGRFTAAGSTNFSGDWGTAVLARIYNGLFAEVKLVSEWLPRDYGAYGGANNSMMFTAGYSP